MTSPSAVVIMPTESTLLLKLGAGSITPGEIVAIADGRVRALIDDDPAVRRRIAQSADFVGQPSAQGDARLGPIDEAPPPVVSAARVIHRYATANESWLHEREVAAVIATRLAVLVQGYCGVRLEVLELMAELLNRRLLPLIPASTPGSSDGGLIPMSYLAAALTGQREANYRGQVVMTSEALRAARLRPIELRPNEALSIMSGTSMATGLGCLAWDRARRLVRFAAALTSMAHDVTQGNPEHFDPRLDALKPHSGTRTVAQWIRDDIEYDRHHTGSTSPDPGVLRCAPQLLGMVVDAAHATANVLEAELSSVSDTPIIHPASGPSMIGGNSYGAHIAFALDGLRNAVSAMVGLLERLLALICAPDVSRGLPRDLLADSNTGRPGFGPLRSTAAGLAAQARKHALPSTGFLTALGPEHDLPCPAQLSAIDALRVLSVAETVASIVALGMCQAVDLRDGHGCHRRASAMYGAVRQLVPMLTYDRAQDRDIKTVQELFLAGLLPLGHFD